MKEIAIITSGFLPVPNVMGGAVEALEMTLLRENERSRRVKFRVYSIWDERAEEVSHELEQSCFRFVKPPAIVRGLDRLIYRAVCGLTKLEHTTTFRYLVQRVWFIMKVAWDLRVCPLDAVLVEDHPVLFACFKLFGNAKRYEGRVYYHLHRDFQKDFGMGREIAATAKTIGVSQFSLNSLRRFLQNKYQIEKPVEECCVIRNCVDLNRFDPNNQDVLRKARDMRASLGISSDAIVIGYSGRLTPEKGVEELLKAFLEIKERHAELVIAGSHFFGADVESPFEKKLHDLMSQADGRVHFTGYLNYESMPAYYAMCDLMCSPSLCEDAAPMAVVEALASGKPIVATNAGGIPEYTQKGSSILVGRNEHLVYSLANALARLVANGALRDEMSKCATACSRHCSEQGYYDAFISVFDD